MYTSLKGKIYLSLFGIFLALIFLEMGMRISGFMITSLQYWKNMEGIKQQGTYKILCLGESTTADSGDGSSWPFQLENILNEKYKNIRFKVFNEGKGGIRTPAILANLEFFLDKYRPNAVIVMMGINDGRLDIKFYSDEPGYHVRNLLMHLKVVRLLKLLWHHAENTVEATENIQSLEYFKTLISSYQNQGESQKGIETCLKAIDLYPNESRLYESLGWFYFNEEMYDELEIAFNKALDLNPKNASALRGLGLFEYYSENPEKATFYYEKAIALTRYTDKDVGSYIHLAHLYQKTGKAQDAINLLRDRLTEIPNNDLLTAALGNFYSMNDLINADVFFKKANDIRKKAFNPSLRNNYNKLKEIVLNQNIHLFCMQYPMRDIDSLKNMLSPYDNKKISFIENKKRFKDALQIKPYDYYFTDLFGGDFGHCTKAGNQLIAENAANGILKKLF